MVVAGDAHGSALVQIRPFPFKNLQGWAWPGALLGRWHRWPGAIANLWISAREGKFWVVEC